MYIIYKYIVLIKFKNVLMFINFKILLGTKKLALFPAIDQNNYIPDELHLLLRISDTLMECFFNDLTKKKEFEKQIKPNIEAAFKDLGVRFEFFKSTSSKWN